MITSALKVNSSTLTKSAKIFAKKSLVFTSKMESVNLTALKAHITMKAPASQFVTKVGSGTLKKAASLTRDVTKMREKFGLTASAYTHARQALLGTMMN